MKHLIALTVFAALAACAPKGESHAGHDMAAMSEKQSVVISEARVLPPFPGKDTAAAYFTLSNQGKANKLVSVSSPISDAVEIHNHIEEDGVMKMRRVEGITLAAGEDVALKPGSYHIMMFKANLPETQGDVALTLTYENGETVTVIAPVEGRESEDDHSGH